MVHIIRPAVQCPVCKFVSLGNDTILVRKLDRQISLCPNCYNNWLIANIPEMVKTTPIKVGEIHCPDFESNQNLCPDIHSNRTVP